MCACVGIRQWTTIGVQATVPGSDPLRQLDPLLSSWMSSPSDCFQDFPVLADLASEQANGLFLTHIPGNSIGGSVSANHDPTAASKYSNTERPCCVHVAITVQIRSHHADRLGCVSLA